MVMADASSVMRTTSIRLLWSEDEWCRQFLCSHPFLSHPPFLAQLWQWNVTWDISTMLILLVVTLHSWDIHWCNFILLWIHEVNIMITMGIDTISCGENMQLIAAEKCLVTTCHECNDLSQMITVTAMRNPLRPPVCRLSTAKQQI
jgi:hypothetical protein